MSLELDSIEQEQERLYDLDVTVSAKNGDEKFHEQTVHLRYRDFTPEVLTWTNPASQAAAIVAEIDLTQKGEPVKSDYQFWSKRKLPLVQLFIDAITADYLPKLRAGWSQSKPST